MKKTLVILLILVLGCTGQESSVEQVSSLSLSSPAFNNNEIIPEQYGCDGENVPPSLIISGIPENAESLVLIMDDPDAPLSAWVHWVVFNIPATGEITNGVVGVNDWEENNYGGPCPPSGTHRYFFKVYALDTTLELSNGASKEDVLNYMEGHVIGSTQLVGLYSYK